jgi:hypothetical protein
MREKQNQKVLSPPYHPMQLFGEGSLQAVACLFFVKPYKKLTESYKKLIANLTL